MSQNNQVSTPSGYSTVVHEDEINLGELFSDLFKQWKLISSVTFVITFLAVIYALNATPLYNIKSYVALPTDKDIQKINENGLEEIEATEAFNLFIKNLNSQALLRTYFDEQNYVSVLAPDQKNLAQDEIDNIYFRFLSEFSVKLEIPEYLALEKNEVKPKDSYAVSYIASNSEQAAEFINGFIKYSEEQTLSLLNEEQLSKKEVQLSRLQNKIDALLEQARLERENQIVLLEESLKIADSMDIEDPLTLQQALSTTQAFENASLDLSITDQMMLLASTHDSDEQSKKKSEPKPNSLYLRGTKVLEAELKHLKSRTNDLPFIPEARRYQLALAELNQYSLDFSGARLMKVELPAFASKEVVKPNKKLIVAGALVGGLFLALILALIRIAVIRNEEHHHEHR